MKSALLCDPDLLGSSSKDSWSNAEFAADAARRLKDGPMARVAFGIAPLSQSVPPTGATAALVASRNLQSVRPCLGDRRCEPDIEIRERGLVPLRWTIRSDERLFEVICDGLVSVAEIHEMLDVLVGAKALGYRKLFDGTHGETTMGPLDILNIGVRIRALHAGNIELGPLAVVAPDDKYILLSRVLGILAAPRRPMRIFKDAGKARDWLTSPATGSHRK